MGRGQPFQSPILLLSFPLVFLCCQLKINESKFMCQHQVQSVEFVGNVHEWCACVGQSCFMHCDKVIFSRLCTECNRKDSYFIFTVRYRWVRFLHEKNDFSCKTSIKKRVQKLSKAKKPTVNVKFRSATHKRTKNKKIVFVLSSSTTKSEVKRKRNY